VVCYVCMGLFKKMLNFWRKLIQGDLICEGGKYSRMASGFGVQFRFVVRGMDRAEL